MASQIELTCGNLSGLITATPIVQNCDRLGNESLRLQTLFVYPNGSNVDVFLEHTDDLLHPYRLSDYGNTTEFLINCGLDPWATRKRRQTIAEICESVGVTERDKELEIRFADDAVPFASDAIVRLGQACIRVAGLHLTKRYRAVGAFREEFEERILTNVQSYDPDYELPGRFGRVVRVDFKVSGRRTRSLVQTISMTTPTAAHQVANETFVRWFDLSERKSDFQFLTVYDTTTDVMRDADVRRLGEVSQVLAFPEQADAIQQALAA